jgi:hypothetical protein
MSATFRIAIWFFSALLTALPIYVVVAPTPNEFSKLLELSNYSIATKSIFFFYFSATVAAFFNLIECAITSDTSKFWRLALGLSLLLIFFQIIVAALYYRDIYFDRSIPPPSFSANIFVWTITQSFFARLFFLAGRG